MHPQKKALLWINVAGGVGVLVSYAYGQLSHLGDGGVRCGEVRFPYTAGMLLAALAYFAFTYYLLLQLDPAEARVGKRFRCRVFNWLYAAILAPSALWMPLTWMMGKAAKCRPVVGIRAVLAMVALAALGLVAALL